jgi:hypothetical protein
MPTEPVIGQERNLYGQASFFAGIVCGGITYAATK